MRKFILAFLCLVSFSTIAATTPKEMIKIQHWKTSAGASVFFVALPNLPMLDIRVIFAAGSAYDGKTPGLAVLTNNLIGGGTTTQNANQIAKAFDNIGAQFNTGADRDKAVVSLRSLSKSKYRNPALAEFTQVLTKMSFNAKVLQRVKNQTIAAIKVEGQEPGNVAEIAFYKTIYGKQPYAHNPLGSISSVKRLLRANINRFYQRYYVAKNADIVLVGALTKAQATQIAERISKALPEGKTAPRLKESKPLQHKVYRHIKFPTKQTAIMIGQMGINRQNPDYFPLVVGNYAFGGLPLGSVLFQQVRNKKGLAYYVGSVFEPLRYRGPFIIQLKTRADKTKEALSIVQSALDSFLKKGPTEKQLDAAKLNLIGSFPLRIASNKNIASIVSLIAFYHRPLTYLNTYERNVRAVTTDQVKTAFEKTIDPKYFAIITVGPQRQK